MPANTYRVATNGFTPEQWDEFMKDGFLTIEDALSDGEVDTYLEATDRLCKAAPK